MNTPGRRIQTEKLQVKRSAVYTKTESVGLHKIKKTTTVTKLNKMKENEKKHLQNP